MMFTVILQYQYACNIIILIIDHKAVMQQNLRDKTDIVVNSVVLFGCLRLTITAVLVSSVTYLAKNNKTDKTVS